MLFTIFNKGILLLFLSLASCEVDRALGQRIHVINHVITYYTFTSATWWTFFFTLWSRVRCVAYNYVVVHEYEWMICDELESLQAKPLSTRWRPRVILHGDVIRKSKKKSMSLTLQRREVYEAAHQQGSHQSCKDSRTFCHGTYPEKVWSFLCLNRWT